jgi:hypothetical protein
MGTHYYEQYALREDADRAAAETYISIGELRPAPGDRVRVIRQSWWRRVCSWWWA